MSTDESEKTSPSVTDQEQVSFPTIHCDLMRSRRSHTRKKQYPFRGVSRFRNTTRRFAKTGFGCIRLLFSYK